MVTVWGTRWVLTGHQTGYRLGGSSGPFGIQTVHAIALSADIDEPDFGEGANGSAQDIRGQVSGRGMRLVGDQEQSEPGREVMVVVVDRFELGIVDDRPVNAGIRGSFAHQIASL